MIKLKSEFQNHMNANKLCHILHNLSQRFLTTFQVLIVTSIYCVFTLSRYKRVIQGKRGGHLLLATKEEEKKYILEN